MRVFSCLCYTSTIASNRTKIDPRAYHYVFLGYPFNTKGYKILNLKTRAISISRDVIFYGQIFPFSLTFSKFDSLPPSIPLPSITFDFHDYSIPITITPVDNSTSPVVVPTSAKSNVDISNPIETTVSVDVPIPAKPPAKAILQSALAHDAPLLAPVDPLLAPTNP